MKANTMLFFLHQHMSQRLITINKTLEVPLPHFLKTLKRVIRRAFSASLRLKDSRLVIITFPCAATWDETKFVLRSQLKPNKKQIKRNKALLGHADC